MTYVLVFDLWGVRPSDRNLLCFYSLLPNFYISDYLQGKISHDASSSWRAWVFSTLLSVWTRRDISLNRSLPTYCRCYGCVLLHSYLS